MSINPEVVRKKFPPIDSFEVDTIKNNLRGLFNLEISPAAIEKEPRLATMPPALSKKRLIGIKNAGFPDAVLLVNHTPKLMGLTDETKIILAAEDVRYRINQEKLGAAVIEVQAQPIAPTTPVRPSPPVRRSRHTALPPVKRKTHAEFVAEREAKRDSDLRIIDVAMGLPVPVIPKPAQSVVVDLDDVPVEDDLDIEDLHVEDLSTDKPQAEIETPPAALAPPDKPKRTRRPSIKRKPKVAADIEAVVEPEPVVATPVPKPIRRKIERIAPVTPIRAEAKPKTYPRAHVALMRKNLASFEIEPTQALAAEPGLLELSPKELHMTVRLQTLASTWPETQEKMQGGKRLQTFLIPVDAQLLHYAASPASYAQAPDKSEEFVFHHYGADTDAERKTVVRNLLGLDGGKPNWDFVTAIGKTANLYQSFYAKDTVEQSSIAKSDGFGSLATA